ncbi:methyltransferase domain-containing protein [Parvularcula oceani]|uniref:methyltransferase domain-containing protein n=1 Tax=Parvularcula oceani TaxID=1247963 RepID=UPI0004E18E01|nr:methyltransferase domain-containing protein [Parvularcula oceani]
MREAVFRPYGRRAAPRALPERMDGETAFETFRDTLESLASVNRMTFGYRPNLRFLDRALENRRGAKPLLIVDVGSGYGDGLRAMARHLAARGVEAELVGVDRNPHAARASVEVAMEETPGVKIRWITADVFDYARRAPRPDLVTSALFTHHLEDEALPRFLRWMDGTARAGWLVNDLYRSRFAAAGFGLAATLLRKHPFVRHDGPVSFARSFRSADWRRFLAEAEIEGAELRIGAPFRLCVEKHV